VYIKSRLDIHRHQENIIDDIYTCISLLSTKADEASKYDLNRLEHYMALMVNPKTENIKSVVLHGVHQFTPKILAFIKLLQKNNIEPIFLMNYNIAYRNVYQTWETVYSFTGHDFTVAKKDDVFDGRLVGECIGNILEGRRTGDVRLDTTITRYSNKTEFTDNIAEIYKSAEKKSSIPSEVLSRMEEQFYGVQSDPINEILKFYFPNQFGDRHFLAYPIGQFILSLYSMWDDDKGLIVNEALLKECFSVNIWNFHGTSTPISLYEKIKLYISDLDNLSQIIERLQLLKTNIEKLDIKNNNPIYGQFPFFNCSAGDVDYFIRILLDLQTIADELFGRNNGEKINFRTHFEKLIKLIALRMKDNRYVSDQERQLVFEVQQRLSSLKGSRSIEGSIDDLRETLHYYLRNEGDDESAHWIVRNLEQIDGGVLLSPYTKAKTYHYALMSDKNMKKTKDAFFPWPLNQSMMEAVIRTVDEVPVILNSYKEYRNFLRYCIFLGTYYLDSKKMIRFSYVEDDGLEQDIPYYILSLIGLKTTNPPTQYALRKESTQKKAPVVNRNKIISHVEAMTRAEQETYRACKYRFLLSHVVDTYTYFPESFDSRRLYSLLLFTETWQRNVGTPENDIRVNMQKVSAELRPLFPFYKTVDFADMENIAYYYLTARGMIKRGCLQEYPPNYVRRKVEFKDQTQSRRFQWSSAEVQNYLSDYSAKEPLLPPEAGSVLCKACNQLSICMRGYLQEEEI